MFKKPIKNAVEIPKTITAMFLVQTVEECQKIAEALKQRKDSEFVSISGIKILYRKDAWEIIES